MRGDVDSVAGNVEGARRGVIMMHMTKMQKPEEYYRHCPGQNYPISDAICAARQARHYPICRDCPLVTGAAADSNSKSVPERNLISEVNMIEKVFKAYDIRGTYPDQLNEELAWRIGHATAQFLRSQLKGYDRSDPKVNTLAVGHDMRKSSPSLVKEFINGVLSAGVNCIDVGMIDTAQIYFAVNHLGTCGGVQTTASHNPAQYNGFKITGQGGKPIGQDTGLQEIQRMTAAIPPKSSTPQANLEQRDLSQQYKRFILGFLNPLKRKLKIVVDASNGMGGKYWPIIFGDVENLETIPLNFEHTGEFVHDPNPLVEANLRMCRDAVKQHGADLGICLDGDADRCMVIDETSQPVPCDLLTALLARKFLNENPGATIVYDLRSSWAVREEIERAGGVPRRERVGHAFMKKAMNESNAVFGGELSGHFYFRDNWFCDSAFLAAVTLLNVIDEAGKPVSELIQPLKRYCASGERNFRCEDKDARIEELARRYSDAEVDFLDGVTVQYSDWWFNVRKSNTEPLLRLNMEAKTADLAGGALICGRVMRHSRPWGEQQRGKMQPESRCRRIYAG